MQDYSLTISENRKVNIKPSTATAMKPAPTPLGRPTDRGEESLTASSHSSSCSNTSKEKRTTTTSRRQQRHSTEIGSEYYRWWAVRSSLGFQTNEHIAGLLLDGFHALLQHIVFSCGGEEYPGQNDIGNGVSKDKNEPPNNPSVSSSSSLSSSSTTLTSSSTSSFSSSLPTSSLQPPSVSQMTKNFTSSLNSPPGAEEMEGFSDFNHAIAYYTNTLWWMCAQPDSGLHKMRNASPVLQEFILRLIGYLRGGRSFSLNDRKRTFPKETSSSCPNILSTTAHVNSSFSFPVMTFTPLSTTDITKPQFIGISGHGNSLTYPSYITPNLTPLMLPCKVSTIVPNSAGTKHHIEYPNSNSNNGPKRTDCLQNTLRIVGGKIQGDSVSANAKVNCPSTDNSKSPSFKENQSDCKNSFHTEETLPNFLNGSPSKLEIDSSKCDYRPQHDFANEYQKSPVTKDCSMSSAMVHKHLQSSTSSSSNSTRGVNVFAPELKHLTLTNGDVMASSEKNSNVLHLNETKPSFQFNTPATVKETFPRSHKGFAKDSRDPRQFHQAFTQGTPLLFFPTQQVPGAPDLSMSTGCGGGTNVTHKFVANSAMEGFYGQCLSNSGIAPSQRSQCITYPPSDVFQHSINQQSKQRPVPSLPLSYTSPLLTSRSPSINPSTMIPLFYSPTATAMPKLQTTTNTTTSINSPWTSCVPSYNLITSKNNGGVALNPFICNQNNTMRDNFNLFRMYQDISKPPLPHSDKHTDITGTNLTDEFLSSKKNSKLDLQSTPISAYSPPFDNQDKHHNDSIDVKDSETISIGHFYSTTHQGNHPFYLPKHVSKPDYNNKYSRDCINSLSGHTQGFYDRNLSKSQCGQPVYDTQRGNPMGKQNDQRYPGTESTSFTYDHNSGHMKHVRDSKTFSISPTAAAVVSTTTITRQNTSFETETKKSASPAVTDAVAEVEGGQQPMERFGTNAAISTNAKPSSSSRLAKALRPRRFVCSTCSKVFYSGTDLVVHRYEQHSHVCSECDGRFLSLSRLHQHKVNDHPQMLVCSYCRFTTFNKDLMEDHKRSHRPGTEHTEDTKEGDPRREAGHCTDKTKNLNLYFTSESAAATYSQTTITPSPGQLPLDCAHRKEAGVAENGDRLLKQIRSDKDQRKYLSDKHNSQDQQHNSIVREDGDVWTQCNRKTDTTRQHSSTVSSDTPCPGSVFPSFSKSRSYNMTSSKVHNIVNLFSQVRDYCRFDPNKFLPTSLKEELNEADNKRQLLTTNTSSDSNSNPDVPSKDQCPVSRPQTAVSHVEQDSQTDIGNGFVEDSGDGDVKIPLKIEMENNTPSQFLHSNSHPQATSGVLSFRDCVGSADLIDAGSDSTSSKKKQQSARSRKKRRKGQSVKYSSKRIKNDRLEYSLDNVNDNVSFADFANTCQPQLESGLSEFQINEESAQNSVIKPHTVWLDDYPSEEGLRQPNDGGTWSTLRPIDGNCSDNSQWKELTTNYKYQGDESDISPHENSRAVATNAEDDNFSNRILSLRERHRSHSLPPKKRGIRKSYRINSDNTKANDSENFSLRTLFC